MNVINAKSIMLINVTILTNVEYVNTEKVIVKKHKVSRETRRIVGTEQLIIQGPGNPKEYFNSK